MELPKRKRNRLPDYDYCTPNAYFITICLKDRKNLLWQAVGAASGRPQKIALTNCGKVIEERILQIQAHYPGITVDQYAIMPDHIHLLLQIQSDVDGRPLAAPTISHLINQFKGTVTKKIGQSIWQKGFYDHIIRDENDYQSAWRYIVGNAAKLAEQKNWEYLVLSEE